MNNLYYPKSREEWLSIPIGGHIVVWHPEYTKLVFTVERKIRNPELTELNEPWSMDPITERVAMFRQKW